MENKKPFYLSKTVWLQVLALIAVLVPASAHFIQQNLSESAALWGVLNLVLRVISKDRLSIS